MDLRSLYEEVILDHNRNPRNYPKKPEDANRSAHGYNPLCGDDFHVHLTVQEGVITDIGFEGVGCAISTASASLMTEALKGKEESQAHVLFGRVHELVTAEQPSQETEANVGKLSVLGGVREYPMRVKCATLAWHTLEAALTQSADMITTE